MKNFSHENKSGDRRNSKPFGKSGFSSQGNNFARKNSDVRQMFSATCGKCGNSCEVPFKPADKRPILCNSCFKHQDSPMPGKNWGKQSYQSRPSFEQTNKGNIGDLKQYEAINAKLDRIIDLLNTAPAPTLDFPIDLEAPKPKKTIKASKTAAKKTKKQS